MKMIDCFVVELGAKLYEIENDEIAAAVYVVNFLKAGDVQ
jgi:hypothetical protein